MQTMQKIATKVFICASVVFGIVGIVMVFVGGPDGNDSVELIQILRRVLLATVCVILSSFALSVAGKYLSDK